jgi:hypothetical protein
MVSVLAAGWVTAAVAKSSRIARGSGTSAHGAGAGAVWEQDRHSEDETEGVIR